MLLWVELAVFHEKKDNLNFFSEKKSSEGIGFAFTPKHSIEQEPF